MNVYVDRYFNMIILKFVLYTDHEKPANWLTDQNLA